jgi:hypothetical protein
VSHETKIDIAGLLARLAEAQKHAEQDEASRAELPGLIRAQRLVREYADWPVEADSDR